MSRAAHVGRLLQASWRHGRVGGRLSVLVVVVVGLLLLAFVLTAKAVVPLVAYPFA